jgi:hypothetical protein
MAPGGPGRRKQCADEVVARIVDMHLQEIGYGTIAAALNSEGVPTPAGKPRWLRSHVDRVLHTRYAAEVIRARLAADSSGRSLGQDGPESGSFIPAL